MTGENFLTAKFSRSTVLYMGNQWYICCTYPCYGMGIVIWWKSLPTNGTPSHNSLGMHRRSRRSGRSGICQTNIFSVTYTKVLISTLWSRLIEVGPGSVRPHLHALIEKLRVCVRATYVQYRDGACPSDKWQILVATQGCPSSQCVASGAKVRRDASRQPGHYFNSVKGV